ncbi:MAG: hypothetical protein HUJ42_01995 [Malacoplasma sp.]|nr:hypothetical protein [Malacoplasma sp.]
MNNYGSDNNNINNQNNQNQNQFQNNNNNNDNKLNNGWNNQGLNNNPNYNVPYNSPNSNNNNFYQNFEKKRNVYHSNGTYCSCGVWDGYDIKRIAIFHLIIVPCFILAIVWCVFWSDTIPIFLATALGVGHIVCLSLLIHKISKHKQDYGSEIMACSIVGFFIPLIALVTDCIAINTAIKVGKDHSKALFEEYRKKLDSEIKAILEKSKK